MGEGVPKFDVARLVEIGVRVALGPRLVLPTIADSEMVIECPLVVFGFYTAIETGVGTHHEARGLKREREGHCARLCDRFDASFFLSFSFKNPY